MLTRNILLSYTCTKERIENTLTTKAIDPFGWIHTYYVEKKESYSFKVVTYNIECGYYEQVDTLAILLRVSIMPDGHAEMITLQFF